MSCPVIKVYFWPSGNLSKVTWFRVLLLFHIRLQPHQVCRCGTTTCLCTCGVMGGTLAAADATGKTAALQQQPGPATFCSISWGFFHPQCLIQHPLTSSLMSALHHPHPGTSVSSPSSMPQFSLICLHHIPSIFNSFLPSKNLTHFLVYNFKLKKKKKVKTWFV